MSIKSKEYTKNDPAKADNNFHEKNTQVFISSIKTKKNLNANIAIFWQKSKLKFCN